MNRESKDNTAKKLPTLRTERLVLRPFEMTDAPSAQKLCGAREVAATTASIPHPYEDGVAEEWIATHAEKYAKGECMSLAITLAEVGEYIGGIGLSGFGGPNKCADIGYVIGVPFWGNGYCTEAARVVFSFGFEQLGLNRITAHHFACNSTSGRVMQKLGMTREGTLRQHVLKWDEFHDVEVYGILKGEWVTT